MWDTLRLFARAIRNNSTEVATITGADFLPIVSASGSATVKRATIASAMAAGGTSGIGVAGGFALSPRNWHTGGKSASVSTDGTNLDIVVTELYLAEVFIPANATITGVAVLNGTAVAGNIKVMLFSVVGTTGTRVAISATTAASGTTAYQRVPFSSTYAAVGPASYFVGVMGDNSGGDLRTHVLGNFGAGKITGLVYATETGYASVTVPTTFTTGLGPIASLY